MIKFCLILSAISVMAAILHHFMLYIDEKKDEKENTGKEKIGSITIKKDGIIISRKNIYK